MNTPEFDNSVTPPATADWTDEELSAAVNAYLYMLRSELEGRAYVKSAVNKSLREGALSARTKASIEFRMQNISATLYDLRIPHIFGYLPAKNVGSGVKSRILEVLNRHGIAAFLAYVPTADNELLERRVTELRKSPLGRIPPGATTPAHVTITTTGFVRDPAVKRWVLDIADGKPPVSG
jgi:5-methylcytosine-specific restriction enzyme A